MNLKLMLIFAFSLLYGAFEVFMNLRQSKTSKVITPGDRGSLRLIYILISVGYFLSFSVASSRMGRIYHWNLLFSVGASLALLGLSIRIGSLRTLKRFFTYGVAEVEGHQLIQTGLYRIVRHPGYLGQMLIFLGISIALSNWIAVFGMMIPVTFGFLNRIRIEERFLLQHFGQEYRDYQKRTAQIIPGIF